MVTGILPAASFTAATTAPATLSALDVLDFATRHLLTGVTGMAIAAVVLLVVWSFRRAGGLPAVSCPKCSLTGPPVSCRQDAETLAHVHDQIHHSGHSTAVAVGVR